MTDIMAMDTSTCTASVDCSINDGPEQETQLALDHDLDLEELLAGWEFGPMPGEGETVGGCSLPNDQDQDVNDDLSLQDVQEQSSKDFDWNLFVETTPRVFDLRASTLNEQARHEMVLQDLDDTGDYDPEIERRQNRPRKRKRILRNITVEAEEDEPDEETDETINPPPTILSFTNDSIRKQYSEMVARHESSKIVPFEGGCRLRKRVKNTQSDGMQAALPDELSLFGTPSARGCRACLALDPTGLDPDLRCSMLDNEFEWPCRTCIQDGEPCVAVTRPVRKGACETCSSTSKDKSWLICSHIWDPDSRETCRYCEARGSSCNAGPDWSTVRPRLRIGHDNQPEMNTPPAVSHQHDISCKGCQLAHRVCSLVNSPEDNICFACLRAGVPCEKIKDGVLSEGRSAIIEQRRVVEQTSPAAVLTPAIRSKPSIVNRSRSIAVEAPSPARRITASTRRHNDTNTQAALFQHLRRLHPPPQVVRSIKTKFCHPMIFNVQENECHFCANILCPLIGFGERQVIVKEVPARGYVEISGGHAAENVENTHICSKCTFERLQIIACEKHNIQRALFKSAKFEKAFEALTTGNVEGYTWCSVCCNLAHWECCAKQDEGENGCGLTLCNLCRINLSAFNGDMDRMLAGVKDEMSSMRPVGFRADYMLLSQQGLLFKFLMNGDAM